MLPLQNILEKTPMDILQIKCKYDNNVHSSVNSITECCAPCHSITGMNQSNCFTDSRWNTTSTLVYENVTGNKTKQQKLSS